MCGRKPPLLEAPRAARRVFFEKVTLNSPSVIVTAIEQIENRRASTMYLAGRGEKKMDSGVSIRSVSRRFLEGAKCVVLTNWIRRAREPGDEHKLSRVQPPNSRNKNRGNAF